MEGSPLYINSIKRALESFLSELENGKKNVRGVLINGWGPSICNHTWASSTNANNFHLCDSHMTAMKEFFGPCCLLKGEGVLDSLR